MFARMLRFISPVILFAILQYPQAASFAEGPTDVQAADSVILLIGDGMGEAQIALARGVGGDPLAMELLPVSGKITTFSEGGMVTDSAAAATAMATGRKTKNGRLGLSSSGERLEIITERCLDQGKDVGLITTDALHGATPAGFAVHVDDRGNRLEITRQIARSRFRVLLAYASRELQRFLPEMREAGYQAVFDREELRQTEARRLIGVFKNGPRPTLAEMVEAALPRLAANPRGFFLLVEEAAIDWKCHSHEAEGTAGKVRDLDEAVKVAVRFAEQHGRTLLIVTADHETGGLQLSPGEEGGIKCTWSTWGHTKTPVPVFATGPGAEKFTGEMDNTDLPQRIAEVIGLGPFPQ